MNLMNQSVQKCALFGCDKPVTNWRISCCSYSHQKIHSAKIGRKTEDKPNKTKEELAVYYRAKNVLRQKRTRKATPSWADTDLIKEFYKESSRLTAETGIIHEVDHLR